MSHAMKFGILQQACCPVKRQANNTLKVQLQHKFFVSINELWFYKITTYVIMFLSEN